MKVLPRLARASYRRLLQAYPHPYRAEFAAEMEAVFAQTLEAAARRGTWPVVAACLRELRDWPAAAWSARQTNWHGLSEATQMSKQDEPARPQDGTGESWLGALAGALPFLLFGIASVLSRGPGRFDTSEFLAFYALVLVGLLVGWVRGFPRWTLAYLGWAVLFAWWWSRMGVGALGQRLGYAWTDQWGWASWAPLGAASIAGLLLTRSLQPLRALAARLWREWAWLSLGAYILLSYVGLLADENHHPYLLGLIAASTLAASAGAALYMRGATGLRRRLGLLVGVAGMALIGAYSESTWDYRAYYGLPASPSGVWPDITRWVIVFIVWGALLLGPALLSLRLRRRPG